MATEFRLWWFLKLQDLGEHCSGDLWEVSSPNVFRSQIENLLWGVSSCTLDGDVKDMDFVKAGRRLSTKKPDRGLLVGLSGDSDES